MATQNNRRFHLIQLKNLTGGCIVRYNAARKIHACAAAAIRMKFDQGVDQVASLSPQDLMECMKEGVLPTPKLTDITKDRYRLANVRFYDCPEYTSMLEAQTPGGAWGQMSFGRMGIKPNFTTLERQLDDRSWQLLQGGTAVGCGSALRLAENAPEIAEQYITAWELMVTSAALIGGIDPDSVPPCSATGDSTTHTIVERELGFRDEAYRRRGRGRNLTRSIASITDPKQIAAIQAALAAAQAKATQVDATVSAE